MVATLGYPDSVLTYMELYMKTYVDAYVEAYTETCKETCMDAAMPQMDKLGILAWDDVTDMRSSQKSVVSVLLGIARGKGLLTLEDSLTQHIGTWSKATPEQEEVIVSASPCASFYPCTVFCNV